MDRWRNANGLDGPKAGPACEGLQQRVSGPNCRTGPAGAVLLSHPRGVGLERGLLGHGVEVPVDILLPHRAIVHAIGDVFVVADPGEFQSNLSQLARCLVSIPVQLEVDGVLLPLRQQNSGDVEGGGTKLVVLPQKVVIPAVHLEERPLRKQREDGLVVPHWVEALGDDLCLGGGLPEADDAVWVALAVQVSRLEALGANHLHLDIWDVRHPVHRR
mmetsp:Transcript_11688/g.33085  ORF Transcript_11688/g.33085 Transcript_11688/m.33085 type:complete len:216 (+) Transcript_11688:140-787(+)